MQNKLRAFVLRLILGVGLGLAGPMVLSGQSACADLGCMGLNSLSAHGVPQENRNASILFDLEALDPQSDIFSNQVINLIERNLVGLASISSVSTPQPEIAMAADVSEGESKAADRLDLAEVPAAIAPPP